MPRWLILLLFCLMPLCASAGDVAVPPLGHRVTDLTGTLSAEHAATLESRLAALEQSKGTQIAILIVPTTQPETIEQYAIRVVDVWKLGRKGVDDGVLVLLAKEDRKSRIEVGYGLEGTLTDAAAKRITTDIMRPYFRQGDFYGGLTAGVNAIVGVVHGGSLPEAKVAFKPTVRPEIVTDFMLVAVIIISALVHVAFGKFMGAVSMGALTGLTVFVRGTEASIAAITGFILFLLMLLDAHWFFYTVGGSSSSGGGFSNSDHGFTGGGGGFGGGGASGDW